MGLGNLLLSLEPLLLQLLLVALIFLLGDESSKSSKVIPFHVIKNKLHYSTVGRQSINIKYIL